jgi:16S rRNA C1402 (ribose-2'-O) methylase RsmI
MKQGLNSRFFFLCHFSESKSLLSISSKSKKTFRMTLLLESGERIENLLESVSEIVNKEWVFFFHLWRKK